MTRGWVVCGVLVAACGDDGGKVAIDAAVDAPWSCPSQTGVTTLPPGQHVLFLNTEGVTLTDDGSCDNAQMNCTPLLEGPTATIPRFLDAESTRDSRIEAIRMSVQNALAPYSIDVVTTRPSSGDYWMSVLGGDSLAIVGVANVASLAPGRCDAANRNGVSIIFDHGAMAHSFYAWTVLSDFGALLGMATTSKNGDCMCRQDGCYPGPTPLCSYGVDVPVFTMGNACGRTTQDEVMILATELGCR